MRHTSVLPQKSHADMRALMQVALGEEKADLTILNAKLVNVYTAEVQEPIGVAVKGPWIARVSADVGDTIGAETRVIDAAGRTLIPGLIDGHTHLSWICSVAAFVPYAIASGVTTVVTETLEPYPVAGIAGVLDMLASLQDQPIRILATAPSMVSISTAARGAYPPLSWKASSPGRRSSASANPTGRGCCRSPMCICRPTSRPSDPEKS